MGLIATLSMVFKIMTRIIMGRYAECHDYLNVMLIVVMLYVIMLNVVMLNVIMLSVGVPMIKPL